MSCKYRDDRKKSIESFDIDKIEGIIHNYQQYQNSDTWLVVKDKNLVIKILQNLVI